MTTAPSTVNIRTIEPSDVGGAIDTISDHVLDENAEARRPVIRQAADPTDDTTSGLVVDGGDRVLGCMIYTLHEGEPLGDHLARPVPHSPESEYAILRYAYLRQEAMGNGHGTAMLDQLLDDLRQSPLSPAAVYVEAWHRSNTLDLRPVLEKYEFDAVFQSEDYWAHPTYEGRTDTCPDCGVQLVDCACEAGVYRRPLAL